MTYTKWLGVAIGWLLVGAFAACGDGADVVTPPETAAGATSGNGGGGDADAGGGVPAGAGGSGAGGGGLTISVGTGGGDTSTGCDKVDFLFVIDNSVSMGGEQAALIASFPSFIQTIESTLTATSDYHIMVVDTDDVTRCTPSNCMTGNQSADTLCDEANGYACNQSNFTACDTELGAGVIHPAGDGASNQLCPVSSGNRYLVENEPNLAGTFSCMAQVGLAGHPSERPMDAMVAAVAPAINGPGGCNEGFLREDAILVVTFISDDPNVEDAGTPQDWYDAVVAAKGGNADAVAMLGLTPNFDGCRPNNKPNAGAHWSQFISLWGARGLEASVCESDYGPFFTQSVSIIDETCDEFVPPS